MGHSSCLVLPADYKYNPRLNIYRYPEIGFGRLNINKVINFNLK